MELLEREGFDERYGARPLQRVIESSVVGKISEFLLEHPGLKDATLRLFYVDGEVRVDLA